MTWSTEQPYFPGMAPGCALLLFFSVSSLVAQGPPAADVAAGQSLFQKSCTACHGENAKGGRGPDLTSGQWRRGDSDADILRNIISGIPNSQMPAFPMPVREGEQIVAYLRSLGAAEEASKGDPVAGKALFFGSAGCSRCHMFRGQGGRLGPDLSLPLGARRRTVNLRQAILDPDASLRPNYETVEVRLSSGQLVRGVAKNEDTFSIQIMDENEHLHMLMKSDLKQIDKPHKSLMPKPNLAAAEVDNVIAFLSKPGPVVPPSEWKPSADLNVSFARLKNTSAEPQNWLTHWGDYRGNHYSLLNSITPANVGSLTSKWSFQLGAGTAESVPLVVDGLMFVTGPMSNATALDARTGKPIWRYNRPLTGYTPRCTVATNRGLAILGDRLFLGTLDSHLVALDAKTGSVIWDVAVEDHQKGFSITHAPLALDGKIIIGITAGECALTGFVDAYDAASGKLLWRHRTIAQKGDPNRASWPNDKAADTGGGPTWMTGTYDAETDTLFWTTGNPAPDYDGSVRAGANLYTCSVLALDPKTGNLKWYFQFSPHDTHDWDANETPVLIDAPFRGSMRKLLIQANRNAFYYVLDRQTGQFLYGKAFAHQNWADGLDDRGHPIVKPGSDPTPEGVYICPDSHGAANFAAPSYDPKTSLFFVEVREACSVFTSRSREPVPGVGYTGTGDRLDELIGAPGAIRALDPATGDTRWNFPIHDGSPAAGVLATAGGVVFAAGADGNLMALAAATGKLLWRYQTGESIKSSPMSYAVDGKQYVAIASGAVLFSFGLPGE
jgi:PQQ-dependent dehydrogenase (methanol/ethanol family)